MGRTKRSVPKPYYRLKPVINKSGKTDKSYLELCCCDINRVPVSLRTSLQLTEKDWDKEEKKIINLPWTDSDVIKDHVNSVLAKALENVNEKIQEYQKNNATEFTKDIIGDILEGINIAEKLKHIKEYGIPEDGLSEEELIDSKIEQEKIDRINEKYWLKFTIRDTLQYCSTMLKFTGVEKKSQKLYPQVSEYMLKVNEVNKKYKKIEKDENRSLTCEEKIKKQKELEKLFDTIMTDFKSLKAFIHRKEGDKDAEFQANHLVYKVAFYRDEARKITYELLFEYDIFEPHVEIYYGIKAISDFPVTTSRFLEFASDTADKLYQYLWVERKKKNDLKENSENDIQKNPKADERMSLYSKRLKLTNNANNGTFWLIWIRKDSRDKLPKDLEDLEIKLKNHFLDFYRYQAHIGKLKMIGDNHFQASRIRLNQMDGSTPIETLYKNLKKREADDKTDKTKKKGQHIKKGSTKRIENRIKEYENKQYLEPLRDEDGKLLGVYKLNLEFDDEKEEGAFFEIMFNKEKCLKDYYETIENYTNIEEYQKIKDENYITIPDRFIRDAFLKKDGSRYKSWEVKNFRKSLESKNIYGFIKLCDL